MAQGQVIKVFETPGFWNGCGSQWLDLISISSFSFFFCGVENGTQGPVPARQVLYLLASLFEQVMHAPFIFSIKKLFFEPERG